MIVQTLKDIRNNNIDILKEDKKVIGYLSDLIPGDKKTQRRIKTAYESGAIKLMYQEITLDKNVLFLKASSCLKDYADFDQELCYEIIGCFYNALDWQYLNPCSPKTTASNLTPNTSNIKVSPSLATNNNASKKSTVANAPNIVSATSAQNSYVVKSTKSRSSEKQSINIPTFGSKAPKNVTSKKLLSIWFFIAWAVLFAAPFMITFMVNVLNYSFENNLIIQAMRLFNSYSSIDEVVYELAMGFFKLCALFSTAMILIAYLRKCKRKNISTGQAVISFIGSYALFAIGIYVLCKLIGNKIFGSVDSGAMLYSIVVFIYLLIVVIVDNHKLKKNRNK